MSNIAQSPRGGNQASGRQQRHKLRPRNTPVLDAKPAEFQPAATRFGACRSSVFCGTLPGRHVSVIALSVAIVCCPTVERGAERKTAPAWRHALITKGKVNDGWCIGRSGLATARSASCSRARMRNRMPACSSGSPMASWNKSADQARRLIVYRRKITPGSAGAPVGRPGGLARLEPEDVELAATGLLASVPGQVAEELIGEEGQGVEEAVLDLIRK